MSLALCLTYGLLATLAEAPATTSLPARDASAAALPSAWRAPETGADSGVFGGGQLFAGVDAPLSPARERVWPRFVIERIELGGGIVWQRALEGVVRLEGIRSASPQSVFGIDRNSLLPRFRLAFAGARPTFSLAGVEFVVSGRIGLIPEPWLERLEGQGSLRGLVALPSERAGLLGTSDLGASAGVQIAGGLIDVVVTVTNGEGKNEVELNPGKNLMALVSSTPLRVDVFDEPLAVSVAGAWRDGSVGVSSTRDHRGLLALTASHPWFHIGAEGVWALGVDGRGDREVVGGGAWADAPLWPGVLGAVVRADLLHDVVASSTGATTTDVLAGVFTDFGHTELEGRRQGSVLRRLRLYLTGGMRTTTGDATVVDDAATAWRVLATVEFTGLTDIISLKTPTPPR
jgi:hypothetical protein